MTVARREVVLEQGEISCPPSRHNCPVCGHVTLVPRGAAEATCGGCGKVVRSGYALDLIVADMQAEGSLRLLTSYEQEEQRRDYARLDAEIMLLMNQLPLEIALERRGQRGEVVVLFRVLDIETVPDTAVWTPGEPRWFLKPGLTTQLGPGPDHPCSIARFWEDSGEGNLRDVAYVREEPFPPPQAHRVVAVAWCDVDMQPVRDKSYKLVSGSSLGDWSDPVASERAMIKRFGYEQEGSPATLVTWNGRSFDLPVLALRALYHGIPWRWYYHERDVRYRYTDAGHCDLMDFLSDYGASRQMKLGDAARLIGLPGKTDMDGSKVADIVAQGAIAENMLKVGRYCLEDVIQTAIVFVRTRYHLGIIDAAGYAESIRSFEESPLVRESGLVVEWDRLKIGGS